MSIAEPMSLPALISVTPEPVLIVNAATIVHLGAMALSLGTVIATDLAMARHLAQAVTQKTLETLERAHRLITIGLVMLWASGLVLINQKTGFQVDEMTPKLMAKIVTVSTLTLTATAMALLAIPMVKASLGRPLGALPLGRRMGLGGLAGLSAAGWGTATLLGGSSILAGAGPDILHWVAGAHVVAFVSGITVAALAPVGMRVEDRQDVALELPATWRVT